MKPQTIRANRLTHSQQVRIINWLRKNGCPWLIGYDETIYVTGNYITVRTWTIKNIKQSQTLWPRHLNSRWTPPTKVRRYRIRHELRWTP